MKKVIEPKRIEVDHNIMFGTCECGAELVQSDEFCDMCGAKILWPERHCNNDEPGCEKLTELIK